MIYFLCLLHLSEISVASTLRNLLKCFYSTIPPLCAISRDIYYLCQSVYYCTYFPSRCESVPSFVHILPNESVECEWINFVLYVLLWKVLQTNLHFSSKINCTQRGSENLKKLYFKELHNRKDSQKDVYHVIYQCFLWCCDGILFGARIALRSRSCVCNGRCSKRFIIWQLRPTGGRSLPYGQPCLQNIWVDEGSIN